MVTFSSLTPPAHTPLPPAQRRGHFLRLLDTALQASNSQFDVFVSRLVDALMRVSEHTTDARQANLHFNASNLLNNNRYVFFHVASSRIERMLRDAFATFDSDHPHATPHAEVDLALVPFAEMDDKVMLSAVARQFDTAHAVPLNALTTRLAALLDRDALTLSQNPFRPELWLEAIRSAWSEFDPDPATHALILPLLKPDVFLTLDPIIGALNGTLIAAGILPDLSNAYRVHKSNGNLNAVSNAARDTAIRQKLRELFTSQSASALDHTGVVDQTNHASGHVQHASGAASSGLLDHLAQLHNFVPTTGRSSQQLSDLKQGIPAGMLTPVDETTIDLLVQVFDSVFEHQHIPHEIKNLISVLQMPLLKTALADKEFFYSDAHPARKLIDLLGRASMSWDQHKGLDDPLYQTMQRTVERAYLEQSAEGNGTDLAKAVSDLEAYLHEEETTTTAALEAPITRALHGEKMQVATTSAKQTVAQRISTGELAPFVEDFLQRRWVPVLTLAHSIAQEKPEVLTNAIKTMDALLWSVKPKATADERKELITRLPAILGMLNKWLNVTRWNDAERLQFFADLAEAHASIVRTPLDLTPGRQLEIAVEAAQKAAQRRLALRAQEIAAPPPDQFVEQVAQLERGAWLEFQDTDAQSERLKLAWVSPLRSLFIFSAGQRRESFSVTAEDLAAKLRASSARVLQIDGIVDRALARALEQTDIGDPVTAN